MLDASEKEEIKTGQDARMRYTEPLILNRKDHTHAFKSVTRLKRDSIIDGKGPAKEKVPPVAYYTPNDHYIYQ